MSGKKLKKSHRLTYRSEVAMIQTIIEEVSRHVSNELLKKCSNIIQELFIRHEQLQNQYSILTASNAEKDERIAELGAGDKVVKDIYSKACAIVQDYLQKNKVGLGGENIFELIIKHCKELEEKLKVTESEKIAFQTKYNQQLNDVMKRTMENRIIELEKEIERLRKRDCNATVQLCYNDGNNPFAREDLKIVDIGVSDNCYVVESQIIQQLQAELDRYKKVTDDTQDANC